MTFRPPLAALSLLALLPGMAAAAPIAPAQLRRHVAVLASDAFEGRKPGTAGEAKTLLYIATQMQAAGLAPAAGAGAWYQPVALVERRPFAHRAVWTVDGLAVPLDQADMILLGAAPRAAALDAPVFFAGRGADAAGGSLDGAVVLALYDAGGDGPDFARRAAALAARGAAAVIAVFSDEVPWSSVADSFAEQIRPAAAPTPAIAGAMSQAAAQRLLETSALGFDAAGLQPLKVRASLEVSTRVRHFDSHNVIGRLAGSGATGESVLLLGHWDHLGLCRPDGAADRICNGAVDNASGIAMLIETARALARGKRPKRDILVMATTAEEIGLLGAAHFAAHPVVPLDTIVAAVNLDTVAIAPRGVPVAVIGRGRLALDALIASTAQALGRRFDGDGEADAFVTRQDGWALSRAGVPTVMVGGAFSDMARLNAFFSGPYHKPDDEIGGIELGGAAEDADLLVALTRALADPKRYRPDAAESRR